MNGEDFNLELEDFAFKPNLWTEVLLKGLAALDLEGKRALELGFGTGIAAIFALRRGIKYYTGIDIDERLIPLALRNIEKNLNPRGNVQLTQSDLFEKVTGQYELIWGCIPQVIKPQHIYLGEGDSYARYFNEEESPSRLNTYGLGLNERALAEARPFLGSGGEMLLVLSGRAGTQVLDDLFSSQGYQPRIVHETTVAHLKQTNLAELIKSEKEGYEFYFYADSNCSQRISVSEAEQRRLRGADSYHKLYAIAGTL